MHAQTIMHTLKTEQKLTLGATSLEYAIDCAHSLS